MAKKSHDQFAFRKASFAALKSIFLKNIPETDYRDRKLKNQLQCFI
jgi:hypothetical protein